MVQVALRSVASVLVLICLCLGFRRNAGFVLPSGVKRAVPKAAQASPSAVALPPAACQYANVLSATTLGLAIAAVAAHRRSESRIRKVAMHFKGGKGGHEAEIMKTKEKASKWFGIGKGFRPAIHRIMKTTKLWDHRDLNRSDEKRSPKYAEQVLKNAFYGKRQFQFASRHFLDYINPMDMAPANTRGDDIRRKIDAKRTTPQHIRKYDEPAKFKKLAIPHWEMPENYTRSVTLQELVAAGVQYGHQKDKWDPRMMPYIYADHGGTHIFDLVQTAAGLNRACYYVQEAAAMGAEFLLISTKEQGREVIREKVQDLGIHYFLDLYWRGTVTNFQAFREHVKILKDLQAAKAQGEWQWKSAQEVEELEAKLKWQTMMYSGAQNMTQLPDICIFVDEVKEWQAVKEMVGMGIPCVGLIDSNNSPKYVDLPIPGNASGARSIELVVGKLIDSIRKGKLIGAGIAEADKKVIKKQWDPWLFSRDRIRWANRRSLRQEWQRRRYGSYERFKECNPFGEMDTMPAFAPMNWNAIREAYGTTIADL